ncbi:hypothetical protein ACQPYK_49675 (plasmid) [Streptosporangium sp. CA-135522]|uniref:hypothetical protein n=1 Tax=Streptosporangium sp. CA-135522 TaxID=3240072 RepID=UPI003D8AD32B
MNEQELSERIEQGAELLDQEYPEWFSEIDEGRLDLRSHCSDVLAQLFGSYKDGLRFLEMEYKEAQDHGLTILNEDGDVPDIDEQYIALTRLWREAINKRLTA